MFKKVTTEQGNEITLNTAQVCWVDQANIIMGNGITVLLSEESSKELEAILFPNKSVQPKDVDTEALELFQRLHKLTGGKGRAVFSLQREKKLKDLLGKHRMTKEDLINAATNIGKDEFLQGENASNKRYGDIDYLLRPDKAAKWSEEQVEKKKGMF